MTDNTKKKSAKRKRGMVVGLAAAAILTVGALAAVLNPTWGRPVLLPVLRGAGTAGKLTYEIGETKTVDGWEITLSRCAGDNTMLYIWMDMKAPDSFVYEPPEDYLNLQANWDLMVNGVQQNGGSGISNITWDQRREPSPIAPDGPPKFSRR